MKAINKLFSDVYLPERAFVIYRSSLDKNNNDIYVEAYDMDASGKPLNAHPLSIAESALLSKALDCSGAQNKDYLTSRGLLPGKVLHISTQQGYAIWHTPPQEVNLLFKKSLTIPCGKAHVPAMLWKAGKGALYVYALKGKAKPAINANLYYAPFFNIYGDGKVCMGTVCTDAENEGCLEDFISRWEDYFFNSYFSHMIGDSVAAKGNVVCLWQQQVGSAKPFPEEVLIKSPLTIKDLIR